MSELAITIIRENDDYRTVAGFVWEEWKDVRHVYLSPETYDMIQLLQKEVKKVLSYYFELEQ